MEPPLSLTYSEDGDTITIAWKFRYRGQTYGDILTTTGRGVPDVEDGAAWAAVKLMQDTMQSIRYGSTQGDDINQLLKLMVRLPKPS